MKFIIEKEADISDEQTLAYVQEVIGKGFVSGQKKDKYSYVSSFKLGKRIISVIFNPKEYGYKISVKERL